MHCPFEHFNWFDVQSVCKRKMHDSDIIDKMALMHMVNPPFHVHVDKWKSCMKVVLSTDKNSSMLGHSWD